MTHNLDSMVRHGTLV